MAVRLVCDSGGPVHCSVWNTLNETRVQAAAGAFDVWGTVTVRRGDRHNIRQRFHWWLSCTQSRDFQIVCLFVTEKTIHCVWLYVWLLPVWYYARLGSTRIQEEFRIGKSSGIPGFGIPGLQLLVTTVVNSWSFPQLIFNIITGLCTGKCDSSVVYGD